VILIGMNFDKQITRGNFMKKMLLAVLVFFVAQTSMALGMPKEKIEARIQPFAEGIEKAKLDKAGDFTKDAVVMKAVTNSLVLIIKNAGAGEVQAFIKLINNDSGRSVLMEIGRLSSIVSDKTATESDITSAKKALNLLALSAKSIELLSKDSVQAKEQQSKVDLAVKVSERIAKFNEFTSETAKKYAQAYELALENGKSPREAMKEASKVKDIKEEDILNCVI